MRFLEEAGRSFEAAKSLPKHNGHFMNWYDTRTSTPLPPFFVSSVDSGNLVCSLLSLKQGCLAGSSQPILPESLFHSLRDYLVMAEEELAGRPDSVAAIAAMRAETDLLALTCRDGLTCCRSCRKSEAAVEQAAPVETCGSNTSSWWLEEAQARFVDVRELLETLLPWLLPEFSSLRTYFDDMILPKVVGSLTVQQLPGWAQKLSTRLEQSLVLNPGDATKHEKINALRQRIQECGFRAVAIRDNLSLLAHEAEQMAKQMDFRLLYDADRNLLSVGYDIQKKQLLASCYDLLASESRSAVFIAIAKGDIPQTSWFRLGRGHTQYAGGVCCCRGPERCSNT